MATVDDPRERSVEAVFAAIERNAGEWRRPFLGPSILGRPCERYLWLTFRWTCKPQHSGRLLALFERGDREEEVQAERMRQAGMTVGTEDPRTGKQFHLPLAPHIEGNCDGMVLGLLEAPKTWHVWDCKTASKKSFDKLLKVGAKEWKPEYVSQLQLYMTGTKLKRAVLWVVCKDDDRLYAERFRYDKAESDRLLTKGARIVFAPRPLSRISEDPGWFECRFCDHQDICQAGAVQRLERNCRTCLSSTPCEDGTWRCDFHKKALDLDEQKAGCQDHLLIPDLLPRAWEVQSAGDNPREVCYIDAAGTTWTDRGGEIRETHSEAEGQPSRGSQEDPVPHS